MHIHPIRGGITGLWVFLFLTGPAGAADWPHWRGPSYNGISQETGWQREWPATGPKRLWQAAVGIGFSSFAVSQGRAYTMGNTDDVDTVYCFDAASGAVVWKHSYACALAAKYYEGGTHATPTVEGNRVYTFSKKGHVFCLDAATGKVVWNKNLAEELGLAIPTWGFAGSPLIQDNLVILNAGTAGTALDKRTGQVVWTSGKEASGYATPVPFTLGQERWLAIFGCQNLFAVQVTDGKPGWSYRWKTSWDVNAADPIIVSNRVFISSGYNRGATLLKIEGRTVTPIWENRNMRNHFNSCVLWQGYLFGPDTSSDRMRVNCAAWISRPAKCNGPTGRLAKGR